MRLLKFKPRQKRIHNSWCSFVLSATLILIIILTNTLFTPIANSREKSFVTVGAYENNPKIFTDPDGNVAGFWPDLLSYIAQKENWNIKYIRGSWDECLERLLNGQIDIMPDVAFTEERDKIYAFSKNPVLASWSRVYVKNENTDIESITDLENKKIAVLKGSVNFIGVDGIKEIVHEFNINCTFIEFDSYNHVFEAIENNLADAGVTNRAFGNKNKKKFNLKNTAVIFQPINIKFAFTKNSPVIQNFSEKIDYHMEKLLKDNNSLYYGLLEKYFETEIAEKTIEVFPMWLKTVLKSIGVLIFCLILVVFISRIQVKKKTRELTIRTNSLRESEEKYRLISENTIDCIWQMNLDLEFTYINEAVFPLFGYTPEEYIGSKLPEHCSSEELEKLLAITADLLDSLSDKTMTMFETSIYHKNGEEIPCEISGKVVLDDTGNPLYAQGVTRVITERKKAEKDLRDSKEKLLQSVQANPIPTYIIDSNHIITNWNNACESLTGFSEAQMVGTKKHWLPFYPEERPNLVDLIIDGATKKEIDGYYEDKINKSILVKGAYEGESFYPDLGEKGKWLFSTAAPLRDQDGNIIGAIETIQDITERKKTEAQLVQAQKMESVGRLAGGVAHDYNNALTAIMGYTELAMMDADPSGPVHTDLNQVLKAGRRAQDITRQLLAFARKQTIAPIVLDLNENVESMLKMLRRLIGEDIDLVWLPGKNLWNVKMDPSQIDQILANLCVNARDAIDGVGKITIETDRVVFDAAYCADHTGFVPGAFVLLSVSDNGCGMDKEILNNIFEPFFTTKAVDKGTGLGLSTVYGIVKQNKGFINVYSEPGKGTTIKIYLPRHEGKAVEIQEESTTEIPQGRGETILVVEDDQPILKLAQKILEGLNYTVFIADTPKGAMGLVQKHTGKIYLLITDVIMPEMNGRELSEQLQSLSPDLKCIFMSGYTANAIAHHGVLDEGVHFIQKPFSKRDLATIVRKVLDE